MIYFAASKVIGTKFNLVRKRSVKENGWLKRSCTRATQETLLLSFVTLDQDVKTGS